MENIVDLVLHPLRMRIIMAISGKEMTTQQIAEALGDEPPATLYRHLKRLEEAGVVTVVSERRVRGTLEKTYTLNKQEANLGADDFVALSKQDHLRYFTTFVATLLDDFSRYLEHTDKPDLQADAVGYHKVPLMISDAELAAMGAAINAAVMPYLQNQEGPGRRRRIFSTILIPDVQAGEQKPEKEKK